jgi:hypothetical protein
MPLLLFQKFAAAFFFASSYFAVFAATPLLLFYSLVVITGRKITIVVVIVHKRIPLRLATFIPNMPEETNRPYPNNLRTVREKRALISRAQHCGYPCNCS